MPNSVLLPSKPTLLHSNHRFDIISHKLHILGPCAAESEEQILRIAHHISLTAQRSDIRQRSGLCSEFVFRAGLWKPRTSPDTFQGVGDVGLKWLQRVQSEFKLPVATEVSTPEQVCKALEAGLDYLWIGARTSANPILVQSIADAIIQTTNDKRPTSLKGIFVKNPVNEDPALWIGNIKRLSTNDHIPVYAIHRGCNHRPCWAMAYALRQTMPDTPLFLDPSHLSGDAAQVPELCDIAAELGYDGLMIEVHDHPTQALSDARQQITPETLETILDRPIKDHRPSANIQLLWLRRMMDEVDVELWNTLARRIEISKQIGAYKKAQNMEVVQPTRFAQILNNRLEWASSHDLSPQAVQQIMDAIHRESIRVQE